MLRITSGKWEIREILGGLEVYSQDDDVIVCDIASVDKTAKQDARLIAAAPSIYKALEIIEEKIATEPLLALDVCKAALAAAGRGDYDPED